MLPLWQTLLHTATFLDFVDSSFHAEKNSSNQIHTYFTSLWGPRFSNSFLRKDFLKKYIYLVRNDDMLTKEGHPF